MSEFESALESTFTGRLGADDAAMVMGCVRSFALKYGVQLAGHTTPQPLRIPPPIVRRSVIEPPIPEAVPLQVESLPVPASSPPVQLPEFDDSEKEVAGLPKPVAPRRILPVRSLLRDGSAWRVDPSRMMTGPVEQTRRWGASIEAISDGVWTDADLMQLTRTTEWWTQSGGDYADIRPHLLVLYSLALWCCWPDPAEPQPVRAPVCLEIGVREGISTLALLHAMRETGGRLISLDIDAESLDQAQKQIRRAGLRDWWEPHCMNADDFIHYLHDSIDVLFIDGDHHEPQVRHDVENYLPRVRPNGMAVLHDYWSMADPANECAGDLSISGVSVVVNELQQTGLYEVLTLPWSHGLSLVRVLE